MDHRELLGILVVRNLKIRYKNSTLGFLWTLLGPLFLIVIYKIFLEILKIDICIESLVTGILCWQFLATCVGDSLHTILGNANLVTKTAFPRMVLPLSTILANLVNFTLTLFVLFVFLLLIRVEFGPLYWLPLIVLTQCALCLGIGFLVSSLNVFYRDVEHLMNIVLLAWFFMSPIMYDYVFLAGRGGFIEKWIGLYFINPMAGIATAYRIVFLSTDFVPVTLLLAPFLLSWGILFLGYGVFQRLQVRFGDEL